MTVNLLLWLSWEGTQPWTKVVTMSMKDREVIKGGIAGVGGERDKLGVLD